MLKKINRTCEICKTTYRIHKFMTEGEHKDTFCPNIQEHFVIIRKQKVAKIPHTIKQKFLDLMWQGKTIGEAKNELCLDLDEATGILDENIATCQYLRKEAKQ